MKQLLKFIRLSHLERGLLVRAAFHLCTMGLQLRLLGFQATRRLKVLGPRTSVTQQCAGSSSPEQIGWAVSVASRYVPGGATCLPQALATHVLLERAGYAARLHIGVAKNGERQLQAHAWVESQGRVVIGGSEVGRYTPLMAVDRDTP